MSKHCVGFLACTLIAILCLAMVGGTASAQPAGGTVTELSATYNSAAGKVQVVGSAIDVEKDIVVIEIHTPSGSLLYFGTAAVNDNGDFMASVTVGTLEAGTYKVRSADYAGGTYKIAAFTVSQAGASSPSPSEGDVTRAKDSGLQVVASSNTVTSITNLSGIVDNSGAATISVSPTQISDAVTAALEEAEKSSVTSIVMEIRGETSADIKSSKTIIPKQSVDLVAASPVWMMTVSTPVASISFDARALNTISESANQDVVILATLMDKDTISDEAKQVVGDRPAFNFSVTSGNTTISEFGGTVTVSVPYKLKPGEDPNAVVIYYISSGGKPELVKNCVYDPATGTVTFKTNHFSVYAVGYNKVCFTDVPESAWYSKAVGFIAARNITTGTGNNNYEPSGHITRSQFIVMIMRAYGIDPNIESKDNFADAGNTYYTGYLAAAKRLGISDGVGNNLFMPEKEITRQEMFVMLHRTLAIIGNPPSGDSGRRLSSFEDASMFEPWAQAAANALVKAGIIRGDGNNLNPTQTAIRAEMAQMLFALLGS